MLTTAVLRFPRRYPLSLLILFIPMSLLLYMYFDPVREWSSRRLALDGLSLGAPKAPSPPPPPPLTVNATTSGILLVSAFFPLSTSKLTLRQYTDALSLFLGRITTDVYFYTTPDFAPVVRSARGELPITINTTFSSPFDTPPLRDFEAPYTELQATYAIPSAPHSATHAGRPFFLADAVRAAHAHGATYEYAFWVDAAAFGGARHSYSAWPDRARLDKVWDDGRRVSGSRPENLLFFQMHDLPDVSMLLWKEHMGPIQNTFSRASFFGGPLKTIAWWERYFYAYHAFYMKQETYKGHDEALVNSLALMHPERIITVWPRDPNAPATEAVVPRTHAGGSGRLGDCGDEDRYYQFWLAAPRERDAMRARWDAEWVWRWEWWTPRMTCRVTEVLPMEWLLKRPFGGSWYPPKGSVNIGKG